MLWTQERRYAIALLDLSYLLTKRHIERHIDYIGTTWAWALRREHGSMSHKTCYCLFTAWNWWDLSVPALLTRHNNSWMAYISTYCLQWSMWLEEVIALLCCAVLCNAMLRCGMRGKAAAVLSVVSSMPTYSWTYHLRTRKDRARLCVCESSLKIADCAWLFFHHTLHFAPPSIAVKWSDTVLHMARQLASTASSRAPSQLTDQIGTCPKHRTTFRRMRWWQVESRMSGRPATARQQNGIFSVTSIGSISRELDVGEPAKQHGDHSCTRRAKPKRERERKERLLGTLSRRAGRKKGMK